MADNTSQSESGLHTPSLPMLAVWCGLLTGTFGLAVQGVLVAFAHVTSPAPMGLEVGWMNAPLVDAMSFGVLGIGLYGVARRWPRVVSFRTAAFLLSFLAFLSALFLIPGLAWYSIVLLAGGCAVQFARFTNIRQGALVRVCRMTLPWLLFVAVGSAAWNPSAQWIRDPSGHKAQPSGARSCTECSADRSRYGTR